MVNLFCKDDDFANKAAFSIPKTNLFQLQVALFHSSPVLERKRRNFCDASHRSNNRFKNYSRRSRRLNANEALLRNIGAYADHLFQSWHDGFDQEDPSSSSGPSWFRQQYTKRSRRGMNDNQRTTSSSKKGFHFCEEDDADVDNIFRSTFGGNRYFHWSFVNDENPQWKNSSGYYSYSFGKNQRYRVEDEYDCSSESDHDGSESNFASDRLALGLRAYGPLKLEDVKNAYRSCALKWHPDRHQGSSKAVAEEKFKLCSAAYQSLCDKLTVA
ncbi:dnaJ subfamily member [Salix suchowensis]|nr:dnaJ subfamily member [Salix suchowensis]